MITDARSVGADPIIIIPQPFGLNPYLSEQLETPAQYYAAIKVLAIQQDVPVIDLSQTYGGNDLALDLAGLQDDPHPNPALYADIASRIASILTGTTQTYPTTANFVVNQTQTVTGTTGNDTLFGSSTANVLVGGGGYDTYVMNAKDVSDTIQNGTSMSTAPSGQLDVLAANHNQLWLTQSGNDLVVDVLGTTQETVIQNWYGSVGAQLQHIVASDGYEIDSGVQTLVQAMASFEAANPTFNPTTTTNTSLTASVFGALTTAVANAYHH
jgi:Ca2+-binding RTX toxin-like protein